MPGFNIGGTGGGNDGANSKVESRRKHRWAFRHDRLANREFVYLQAAQRPHVIFEEAVMHHDQEQVYFAGKHHWDPITLTFYDIQGDPDVSQGIYQWIGGGDVVADIPQATVNNPETYKANAELEMRDGQGEPSETWTLYNAWPIDVNWNDLDYSNTEIQTIEVQLKYDRAVRE